MRQIAYVAFTFLAVLVASLVLFKPTISGSLPRDVSWFELHTPTEATFTKKELEGHWTLMYFGYTNCPDLCPVSLKIAKNVAAELKAKGPFIRDLQVVFVSVDSDRDTPKISDDYAKFFDPSFIGLTANYSQQKNLLGSLDSVSNNDREAGETDYKVFYPTSFFIFDPKGRWAAEIEDPTTSSQVIESLAKVVIGSKPTKTM